MSSEDPEAQRQQAAWRDHAQEELSEGRSRDEVVASLVALGQPEAEARRLVSTLVPRSIWIARIPPDAEPSELAAAPVMGSRREVAAHIHAAMPGMRFDQNGRGLLKCPEYSLEFELGAEKEVTLISLEVRGGVEALEPIRALSRRTGWRVLDREGTFSLPGGEPEVPMESAPARPATGSQPRPSTGSHPRPATGPQPRPTSGGHQTRPGSGGQPRVAAEAVPPWRIAIDPWRSLVVLAILAGFGYLGLGAVESSQINANEQAAIVELTAFAQAERQFAAANSGGFVPPAALVAGGAPASLPVGESDPRFLRESRSGYRFRFQGERDGEIQAPVSPAWRGFAYQAVPEQRGKTGLRNFAYISSTGAIHAREDGFMPGPQDPRVATVP